MKRLTSIATAAVLAVVAVLATHVQAQQSNPTERTFMTFSGPVELPGVTLEPGTYEFRLADNGSRNVVQVFRKDGRDVIGQWTFAQADRPQVSSETVVMFKESREGTTPAVQYWYYPGEKVGKEFIYPKDQAERIAARTGQAVRTEEGVVTPSATASANAAPAAQANAEIDRDASDTRDSNQAAAAASSAEPASTRASADASIADDDAALRNAPAPAQPTAAAGSTTGNRGVPEQSARADTSAQAAPSSPRPVGTSGSAAPAAQDRDVPASDQNARPGQNSELPRTASPLALSGLIGLLSLAGALGTRAFRL